MKKTNLAMLIASITASSALMANTQNSEYVFRYVSTKGLFSPLDLTSKFIESGSFQAESGSLTFRVRSGGSFGAFLGAANPNTSTIYLNFYSKPDLAKGQDIFGIEIRNTQNLIHNDFISTTVPRTGEYRTLTYTFDKEQNKIDIYIDGNLAKSHNVSKFLNDIPTLQNAFLGETHRSGSNKMRFTGDIFYADFDKKVLNANEIAEKHELLEAYEIYSFGKRKPLGAVKTEAVDIFPNGHQGSKNYRIPSLLTTKNGVVIAAIDKRHQHANDWGNIDTAIRRSFDNGKTWEEDQVVLDLVSQPYGEYHSAFLIDPLMVQDKRNGRVFMLLDMFPEMAGLFGLRRNSEGTGYKTIDGKHYRLLTDERGNQYTVREGGKVYDEQNQATDYRVVVEGNQKIAYQDLGDLYDKDNNLLGNIFLNSNAPAGHQSKKAPLMAKKTSHLCGIM